MSNVLRACSIIKDITVNYLKNETGPDQDLNSRSKSLKSLAALFSSYGGVLGKIAQTLSLENENSNVYDQVKPKAAYKTDEYVKNILCKSEGFEDIILEDDVYKNGSLGQVYKGVFKDEKIITKVKYVNLDEEAKCDLSILNVIINFLYSSQDNLGNALVDIQNKMFEELEYSNEVNNQIKLKSIWDIETEYIKIPDILHELCSSNVIVMEYMEGFVSINEFLKNSTQEQRNKIGNLMLEFVFSNLYGYNIYYSDNHYGNFLVKNCETLCVLDFGCITYYDDEIIKQFKDIHKNIFEENKEDFLETMNNIGILNTETSKESKDYCYDFFKLQYEPLTKEGFVFSDEWVDQAGEKKMNLMKEWELPLGYIYLHKIPYGLYHILGKMKTKVNIGNFLFEKYIK